MKAGFLALVIAFMIPHAYALTADADLTCNPKARETNGVIAMIVIEGKTHAMDFGPQITESARQTLAHFAAQCFLSPSSPNLSIQVDYTLDEATQIVLINDLQTQEEGRIEPIFDRHYGLRCLSGEVYRNGRCCKAGREDARSCRSVRIHHPWEGPGRVDSI